LGIEVICRLKSYGSFVRRYPQRTTQYQDLNYLVEITVKDDERGDPLINDEALLTLGILDEGQLDYLKTTTKSVGRILESTLAGKGLTLIDFKLEFGLDQGEVTIIDEISGDSMRVMKDDKSLSQMDLAELLLGP